MPIRCGEVQLLNNQIDAVTAADLFAKGQALERITSVPVLNVLVSLFLYSPNYALPDNLDSLQELRGHTVAAITNSPYLEQYQQLGLVITEAETPEQLHQMLKRGWVKLADSVDRLFI